MILGNAGEKPRGGLMSTEGGPLHRIFNLIYEEWRERSARDA